ncbi:MAG: DUF1572 family protein [Bacteroidetes bacterium]|nr:DUF1572 family protein [Bacteroidota bacterium]
MSFISSLIEIFETDLKKLKEEISLYESDTELWSIKKETKNSGGNLCLHICGNLQHFIGATLGNTDYKRDRDAEFALKDISANELLVNVDTTIEVIKTVLSPLTQEDLDKDFPDDAFGKKSTASILTLLATHMNYHLGQINYHRRINTGR